MASHFKESLSVLDSELIQLKTQAKLQLDETAGDIFVSQYDEPNLTRSRLPHRRRTQNISRVPLVNCLLF